MPNEGQTRAIARFFDRVFRDREIILRADGRVGYFHLRKWMQIAACVAVMPLFGWVLYATLGLYLSGNLIASRDKELAQQQVAYFDLLAEISEYHEQYATITTNLESNQDYLLSLIAKDGSDQASIEVIQEQLRESVTERDRVVLARESLQNRLRAFETDLQKIATKNASLHEQVAQMTSALETTEAEKAQVAEARARLGARLEQVESELSQTKGARDELVARVAALEADLASAVSRRAQLEGAELELKAEIAAQAEDLSTTQAKREQETAANREIRERLESDIAALQSQLAQATEKQSGLEATGQTLRTRIAELEDRALTESAARNELETALESVNGQVEMAGSAHEVERNKLLSERDDLRERLVRVEAEERGLRKKIAAMTGSLEESSGALEAVRSQHDHVASRVQQLEEQLAVVAEAKSRTVANVQNLRGALVEAVAEGEALRTRREAYEGQIGDMEERLSLAEVRTGDLAREVADLKAHKAAAEAERDQLASQKVDLESQVAALDQELEGAVEQSSASEAEVARLTAELEVARGTGERLETDKIQLVERVVSLERELTQMRDAQESIVKRLSERTLSSVDTMEKTISMTGVDLPDLLAKLSVEPPSLGRGGPFIPGDYLGDGPRSDELKSSVALLDLHIGRWEALQEIVRTLPLVPPLMQYRLSSGFGYRKDPLNGRKGFHEGLDFSAPNKTPIYATSSGKVVFAGWRGRYGRFIEIDHGLGIKTRYAHMKKILVKPGQEIGHREKIGLVGSSGRSTGPHLHYEVIVDGEPVDPMNFLKAGNHVFKG